MSTISPVVSSLIATTVMVADRYLRETDRLTPQYPIPARIPKVDFSKDSIIIWVPGTNAHDIPKGFSNATHDFFTGGYDLVKSDYMANWDLVNSIPNGLSTLEALLDYIKKNKRKSTKVYLAGESQGSLVISTVLSKPKYYNFITKASLLGAPGISENHFIGSNKVIEINNKMDPVTISWNNLDRDKALKAVSAFMTGDIFQGVYLLTAILQSPLDVIWLGLASLHSLPFFPFSSLPSFHMYDDKHLRDAVMYLWMTK